MVALRTVQSKPELHDVKALAGKVALVTGGGSGIGRAIACVFAQDGAAVMVADRDPVTGTDTVEHIKAAGGDAAFVAVDVANDSRVVYMVEETLRHWGRLDCAVNNAAFNASFATLDRTEDGGWQKTIDTTLTSVFFCMRAELKAMPEGSASAIVNISSMAAVKGEKLQGPYAAAKAGVLGLTLTAAAEYARAGIRINAICPGGIATPGVEHYLNRSPNQRDRLENSHAMGRLGTPEEVAYAASFLCSDRASFITGHALYVDGGMHFHH